MSCMCLPKLLEFLASLKNLPLNMLAGLLPPGLPQLAPLAQLNGLASGLATVSALASAQAQLAAALRLGLPPFPIPALDLGKLEALAYVAGTTGTSAFSANASLQFTRLATSINLNLPRLMPSLMALLQPLLEPLMDLLKLLQACEAVNASLGINLAVPGVMPQLRLALAARLGVRVAAAASVDSALIANLGSYGRLLNAAAALGFNLALPGVAARFSAALKLAAGLPIPPINIELPLLNQAATLATALAPLRASTLGINLRLPNAWALLKAALAAVLGNLSESLNLSAAEMATLSETARAGAQLSAVPPMLGLGLQLRAMAKLRLPSLNLLPDLGPLAAAARLGEATGIKVWSQQPCSGCPVGSMF